MQTSDLLDEYDLYARYLPGLWCLLPIGVLLTAVGLREHPVVTSVVSLLAVFGGPVILARFVRNRGKRVEHSLWEGWGGAPTTAMLRHAGDAKEAVQRQHLREQVSKVLSLTLPTEEQERRDPAGADSQYTAATRRLRALTDDKQEFRLLFIENKNYGFERNIFAMKPIGLSISTICSAALAGLLALSIAASLQSHWLDLSIGLGLVVGAAAFWSVHPTRATVQRAANAYAERLAEAAWKLGAPSRSEEGPDSVGGRERGV
jgi:hypothetical protein